MMLYLICGLPNAGKTTYSNKFESVLHYDDISRLSFAERNEIYRNTDAECIEGIYNTIKSRKNILECVKETDKRVCIWIDTPLEICLERERNYRHRPEQMVKHSYDAFQPPTYDEGWDEIIVVRR